MKKKLNLRKIRISKLDNFNSIKGGVNRLHLSENIDNNGIYNNILAHTIPQSRGCDRYTRAC